MIISSGTCPSRVGRSNDRVKKAGNVDGFIDIECVGKKHMKCQNNK